MLKPKRVDYSPVAASNQVVAGINYRFLLNAKIVTLYATNSSTIANIYKPLEGERSLRILN